MNTDYESSDDAQQRIQRALNEAKKRALDQKYGLSHWGESKLSPDEEADWLTYLEEFERQFEHAERIPIREVLGDPALKPLADIPLESLEKEIDALFGLLATHNIGLDFLCDVDDTEVYRFITEELLDEEIDDIRIEGMRQCFIYEEFHPNDVYDATMYADNFLDFLFDRNTDYLKSAFSKEELYDPNGAPISLEEMIRRVEAFLASLATITHSQIEVVGCVVDRDYATVEAETAWEGLEAATMAFVARTGRSLIRLKRSPYGGWDVIQANVVGWTD